MHGGLSPKGLKKLEFQIDEQLNGRDPKSPELEETLKNLIDKYSYEVEYHNTLHKNISYQNKYGTLTPFQYRASLSLANFIANGIPTKNNSTIVPEGKHSVSTQTMNTFIKSFESMLEGHPSRKDVEEIMSYDPNPDNLVPSLQQAMKK